MIKRSSLLLALAVLGFLFGQPLGSLFNDFSVVSSHDLREMYFDRNTRLRQLERNSDWDQLQKEAELQVRCSLELLERPLKHGPSESQRLKMVARAFEWKGDRAKAESYFKESLERAQNGDERHFAYRGLARIYEDGKQLDKLLKVTRAASVSFGQPRRVVDWKIQESLCLAKLRKFEESGKALDAAWILISKHTQKKTRLELERDYWWAKQWSAELCEKQKLSRQYMVNYKEVCLELARLRAR